MFIKFWGIELVINKFYSWFIVIKVWIYVWIFIRNVF